MDSETNLQAAMQALGDMPSMQPSRAPESRTMTGDRAGIGPSDHTQPHPTATAALDIVLRTQPDPPRVGENAIEAVVKDSSGQPIADATVTVSFVMPAMPSMGMPAMRTVATLPPTEPGTYCGTGQIASPGRWDVTVVVNRDGRRVATKRLALVVR
jgi:hypothetical protein